MKEVTRLREREQELLARHAKAALLVDDAEAKRAKATSSAEALRTAAEREKVEAMEKQFVIEERNSQLSKDLVASKAKLFEITQQHKKLLEECSALRTEKEHMLSQVSNAYWQRDISAQAPKPSISKSHHQNSETNDQDVLTTDALVVSRLSLMKGSKSHLEQITVEQQLRMARAENENLRQKLAEVTDNNKHAEPIKSVLHAPSRPPRSRSDEVEHNLEPFDEKSVGAPDDLIGLKLQVSDPSPSPMTPHRMHVLVSVQMPRAPPVIRMPIDLVAVIDTSGSMKGEKLLAVMNSLSFLVQNGLQENDRLGLVRACLFLVPLHFPSQPKS